MSSASARKSKQPEDLQGKSGGPGAVEPPCTLAATVISLALAYDCDKALASVIRPFV